MAIAPTKPLNLYERIKETDIIIAGLPKTDYKEAFDAFCEALLLTDLLNKDEKQLIRGLLSQWRANQKR